MHVVPEMSGQLAHIGKQLFVGDDSARATDIALVDNCRLGRSTAFGDVPVESVVAEIEGAVGKPPGKRERDRERRERER